MKLIYDSENDLVIKQGKVPGFYSMVPGLYIPTGIRPTVAYEYDWQEGRIATDKDLDMIVGVATRHIWKRTHEPLPNRIKQNYVDYVLNRSREPIVKQACDVIMGTIIHACAVAHGDMTFENIIIRQDGTPTFIDPGDVRGMLCASIDKGKLLQSYCMRWETREWDKPQSAPSWATELDWAFLVTHWARLQRHWPKLNVASGWRSLEIVRSSLTSTAAS